MILAQAKNKTSAVCEAVCGYNKQKSLEDTLRAVLREEWKHVPAAKPVESGSEPEPAIDEAVLDFLQTLQNE